MAYSYFSTRSGLLDVSNIKQNANAKQHDNMLCVSHKISMQPLMRLVFYCRLP